MNPLLSRNVLTLEGTVETAPVFSHENHQTMFHRLSLAVPRLSGQIDHLSVLMPATMAEGITVDQPLRLCGQLRSFNNNSGNGSRLVLSLFAQELLTPLGQPHNEIRLTGTLCKPPKFRRTPLGRSICDLMLAVPRHYGRSDYLPVIAWGQLANLTGEMAVGDTLSLEGRMQSRDYQKTINGIATTHTAYEVSMMRFDQTSD